MILRPFYFTIGITSLSLGILGVFLPLLPTTPFILLAAFCFARSSKSFNQWIRNHKITGKILHDWEKNRSIPLYAKIACTVMLGVSLTFAMLKPSVPHWARVSAWIISISILSFVWSRPSSKKD